MENEDAEGWNAFLGGDNEALMRLYRRHLSALYKYGYNLVRDRPLVEDAIQDVFLYLHQHRTGLSAVQSVRYYLLRSLRHRLLALLKQHKTVSLHADEEGFFVSETTEYEWVTTQAAAERNRRLRHLVNQLPKRQREALYLIYYEGLGYAEAAEVLGVEVKTAYNLIYSALQKLRTSGGVADLLLTPAQLHVALQGFSAASAGWLAGV